LHNVKELTSLPSRARTSLEALASMFFQGTELIFRLPGRSAALSENVDQWERTSLGVVNVAGCIRDAFVCQHPIFVFLPIGISSDQTETRKPETENYFLISEACCFACRRLAPRCS